MSILAYCFLHSKEVGIFRHSIGVYFCSLELGSHVHWNLIGPKSFSSKMYNEYHKSCDWLWLCHVTPHYCFHCLQIACRENLIVLRLIRSWRHVLTIPQLWFVYISHTFKGSWCQLLAKEWWINISRSKFHYQNDCIPYKRSTKNKAYYFWGTVPKTIKEKRQTHLRWCHSYINSVKHK